MRGARLERLAVLHHRLDRIGRDGAGEALMLGLFSGDDGHRQAILGKAAIHFEHLQRLFARFVGRGVRGMPFLPQKLAGAQEHPRAHFPAHHIRPLVDQHRQIAPALHPARERRPDHRLAGRPHDQRLLQLRLGIGHQAALAVGDQPVMRDDRHFLGEAFHMLGFLLEIGKRDEQWEIAILVPGRANAIVEQALDAFPDAISPRPDHHAAAHPRFLGHVGFGDDGLIPGGKVRFARDGKSVLDHGPRR